MRFADICLVHVHDAILERGRGVGKLGLLLVEQLHNLAPSVVRLELVRLCLLDQVAETSLLILSEIPLFRVMFVVVERLIRGLEVLTVPRWLLYERCQFAPVVPGSGGLFLLHSEDV